MYSIQQFLFSSELLLEKYLECKYQSVTYLTKSKRVNSNDSSSDSLSLKTYIKKEKFWYENEMKYRHISFHFMSVTQWLMMMMMMMRRPKKFGPMYKIFSFIKSKIKLDKIKEVVNSISSGKITPLLTESQFKSDTSFEIKRDSCQRKRLKN